MAVYQDKAKERIKKGLRRMTRIVDKGKAEGFNEADTRKIVNDILSELLGWNQYENITAEQMISSRYADYVLKTEDEEIAVIEVKAIGLKLKESHLNQARLYAIDEGIEWIVLTNGDTWNLYHMDASKKIPETALVFTVSISGDDKKPAEKTDLFYLMSRESYRKHEVVDYYQRKVALSGENMAAHILSDETLGQIRRSLKKATGQNVTNYDIARSLTSKVFREELRGESCEKRLAQIKRSCKQ